MSEEIKYEAVFGDQSLFDNAPLGTELVGHSGGFYKNSPDGHIYCGGCTFTTDEYRNIGFIAARRIIRTPTWTVADWKAGKLPEVGSEIAGDATGINKVLFSNDEFIVTLSQGGAVGKYSKEEVFDYFNPIETTEERQYRDRNNWCGRANRLISTDTDDRSESAIIYDALLSGELKMPEVK